MDYRFIDLIGPAYGFFKGASSPDELSSEIKSFLDEADFVLEVIRPDFSFFSLKQQVFTELKRLFDENKERFVKVKELDFPEGIHITIYRRAA